VDIWGSGACPAEGEIASDTCAELSCRLQNPAGGSGNGCIGMHADQACGNDELKCNVEGRDAHPLAFSTGQVSTQPITLLSLSGVEGLPFSYFIKYDSHNAAIPSFTQHFLGSGWIDNYSDRLVASGTAEYEWSSIEGTVTFNQIGTTNTYKSLSLKY